MKSFFAHGGITALIFVLLVFLPIPYAAALAGILYYVGREGRDAQYASGLSKNDTMFMPFMPWTWPQQMILDVAGPIIVAGACIGLWVTFIG